MSWRLLRPKPKNWFVAHKVALLVLMGSVSGKVNCHCSITLRCELLVRLLTAKG